MARYQHIVHARVLFQFINRLLMGCNFYVLLNVVLLQFSTWPMRCLGFLCPNRSNVKSFRRFSISSDRSAFAYSTVLCFILPLHDIIVYSGAVSCAFICVCHGKKYMKNQKDYDTINLFNLITNAKKDCNMPP